MKTLIEDSWYALRSLRKRPVFTAVMVLTLALGIGLNVAIFTVVKDVLLDPMSYPEPDRLVWGYSTFSRSNNASVSPPDYVDYRQQSTSFEQLGARRGADSYALTGSGIPEEITGQTITAGFFEALGTAPALGRAPTRDDETIAGSRRIVLSHEFWQRRLGGDPAVIGTALALDSQPHEIIGVMPPGFRRPSGGAVDFWRPLALDDDNNRIRRFHNLRLVGRLRPGVSLEEAQAELDVISARLEAQYPDSNATWRLVVMPLAEFAVGSVRPALLVLWGAVGLVLLIAAANVANLLLTRGTSRRAELALRTALGASRGRLLRQLLTESVLVALLGCAVGVALASFGVEALLAMDPGLLPRADEIQLDGRVLGFAVGLSVLTGLLFGLLPALSAARLEPGDALKAGARISTVAGNRTREWLVAAQVAISLLLLIGAGLLLQSLWGLLHVEPGFEVDGAITATVSLPAARYGAPEAVVAFHDAARQRLLAIPGVEQVGLASQLPLSGRNNDTYVAVRGRHRLGTDSQFNSQQRMVDETYFDAMGVPVLRGRGFEASDRAGAPNVVIINEPFRRTIFPDDDPIGQTLQIDFGEVHEATIVGVVQGMNHYSLGEERPMEFYVPFRQVPILTAPLVIRTSVDPAQVARAIPASIAEIDPLLPVTGVSAYGDLLDRSVSLPRFQAALLALFAGVAVILASIGIYGVLNYYVAQRHRELGVRIALGAKSGDLYRLVLGRGMLLTGIGLVVGCVGALGLTRFLSSLLFGVGPTDASTFLGVTGLFTFLALAASFLPARRAVRTDPMVALRDE